MRCSIAIVRGRGGLWSCLGLLIWSGLGLGLPTFWQSRCLADMARDRGVGTRDTGFENVMQGVHDVDETLIDSFEGKAVRYGSFDPYWSLLLSFNHHNLIDRCPCRSARALHGILRAPSHHSGPQEARRERERGEGPGLLQAQQQETVHNMLTMRDSAQYANDERQRTIC